MRMFALMVTAFIAFSTSAEMMSDFGKLAEKCNDSHPTSAMQVLALSAKLQMSYSDEVGLVEAMRSKRQNRGVVEGQILQALAEKSRQLKAKGADECAAMLGALEAMLKDLVVRSKAIAQLPVHKSFTVILLSDEELKKREKEDADKDVAERAKQDEQDSKDANSDAKNDSQSQADEQFNIDDCSEKEKDIKALETKLENYGSASQGTFASKRYMLERGSVRSCKEYGQLLKNYAVKAAALDKAVMEIAIAPMNLK